MDYVSLRNLISHLSGLSFRISARVLNLNGQTHTLMASEQRHRIIPVFLLSRTNNSSRKKLGFEHNYVWNSLPLSCLFE